MRLVDNGRVLPTPVLSLAVSHGNEQGLLGIAFSPDGTKLYVDYTDPAGDTHVDEYTMNGDVADTARRRELLLPDQPFPNHNGGELIFGPDGMLYIGFGDGGGAGDPQRNGQNLDTLLGKILRIDPTAERERAVHRSCRQSVRRSTPRHEPEIWMYGLRNPWRFSFDRATGDMWIGDVGQRRVRGDRLRAARVSRASTGAGATAKALHVYNGTRPRAGATTRSSRRAHGDGYCAVVGGYVYRGRAIPALRRRVRLR